MHYIFEPIASEVKEWTSWAVAAEILEYFVAECHDASTILRENIRIPFFLLGTLFIVRPLAEKQKTTDQSNVPIACFRLVNVSFSLIDQIFNVLPIFCSLFGVRGIFEGDSGRVAFAFWFSSIGDEIIGSWAFWTGVSSVGRASGVEQGCLDMLAMTGESRPDSLSTCLCMLFWHNVSWSDSVVKSERSLFGLVTLVNCGDKNV